LTWLAHHYRSNQITEPEYLLSYYNLDLKRPPYSEEKQSGENDGRFSKDLGYEQIFDVDREPMESTLDSFREKYIDFNHGMGTLHHEGGREAAPMHPATAVASTTTEFTYEFDNSNLKEKHPFAVKPNDPRYYGEEPFSSGKHSYNLLICLLSESFRVMLFNLFWRNSEKDIEFILRNLFPHIPYSFEKLGKKFLIS